MRSITCMSSSSEVKAEGMRSRRPARSTNRSWTPLTMISVIVSSLMSGSRTPSPTVSSTTRWMIRARLREDMTGPS